MATPFDYANEINKQMSGTYDNEPFREVTGVVQETGGSAIHLMTTVGVIVVTIALIIAGIKIASGNKRSREEGKEKLLAVKAAIDRNPGRLPVYVDLLYDNGTLVKIDLGETCRVAVTLAFLSELDKVVPQGDTSFAPEEKILLAPREPKPWEM